MRQVERAIRENPDAKAVLVNNPTYYGICSDIRSHHDVWPMSTACSCLQTKRMARISILARHLPVSAMAAGADMAAVSHA